MGQSALGHILFFCFMNWFVRERRAPQRQAVGTFDLCLARPKVCPTDMVRPHAPQLMIGTSVNQFCKIWPSADWPYVGQLSNQSGANVSLQRQIKLISSRHVTEREGNATC